MDVRRFAAIQRHKEEAIGTYSEYRRHSLLAYRQPMGSSGSTSVYNKQFNAETSTCHSLHPFIVRTAASFRSHPVNNLIGVHDVAGFAVNAVREVDLQMTIGVTVASHFVDRGRTEALTGIAVLFRTPSRAHVRIKHVQVRRLIFIVSHRRVVDIGNFVEGE